jgi:Protein of unknown function (DUF2510)
MTNVSGMPATPPGWYPDPQGAPISRWWDGAQWTEHTQGGYAVQPAVKAPEGTAPYTPFIWIAALLPIIESTLY